MRVKTNPNHFFLPILLLTSVLIIVSGCGSRASIASGQNNTPGINPDSVKIQIGGPGTEITKPPVVTLTTSDTLQQLYSILYTLPQMPKEQSCTQEAGPFYTLTFLLKHKTLVITTAANEGCRPVTITGEHNDRVATKQFWTLLDKAIEQATPPAHPTQLSIMHVPTAHQAAQTALITNISKVQHLYSAILALPHAGYANGDATYQLVFYENNLTIPATIYQKSKFINLQGNYRTRGGLYSMNDQFQHLLAETFSEAAPAPAHPDQLSLNLTIGNTSNHNITITHSTLIQKLYTKAAGLPLAQRQQFPNCVGDDKVHGKGTWYSFIFSQWGLPVLKITGYEGCTSFVTNDSQQYLQSDQEFWSFVHHSVN